MKLQAIPAGITGRRAQPFLTIVHFEPWPRGPGFSRLKKIGANMIRMKAGETLSVILYTAGFIMAAFVASVYADTRYVSDILVVSVRDGQRPDSAVLGYIKTPAPVEILEENGDYLKIKTGDGLEGWVLAKYIVSEKPDALIIDDMKKTIEQLNKDIETSKIKQNASSNALSDTNKKYEEKIRELEQEINTNHRFTAKAKRDLMEMEKKYKDLLMHSENADEPTKEMKRLKILNTQLNAEITSLKKNNSNPLTSKRIQFSRRSQGYYGEVVSFVAGAGVFLIGFMLGGIVKKKKRSRLI
jgi:SH3 domain protein